MIFVLALLSCVPAQQFEDPRRMLYRALEEECAQTLAARRKAVEAIQTPEAVRRRQEELRARYLAALGPLPEKTPLRARTVATLARDGYRVENVVYETRPDHHVPGNLYVPEGKGPFPGILFPLGHYAWPRAAEEYQRSCILLAKHGFVVLTYDPPGQGERHQLVVAGRGPDAHGTTEHTLIDCGARLVGGCAAQVFVWDAMRGLDYLSSRPEVDPKRLGCAGNSGGGTTTALLMAADERVACAVPNCFITTWEKLYAGAGPQDGEANVPGQVAMGFNHADFSILRAPRPTQLSCPNRDYYDIVGAWETFRESKRLYGILGHAERMDLFEWDDKHSISRPDGLSQRPGMPEHDGLEPSSPSCRVVFGGLYRISGDGAGTRSRKLRHSGYRSHHRRRAAEGARGAP
jgi:dienelactone hydrolase